MVEPGNGPHASAVKGSGLWSRFTARQGSNYGASCIAASRWRAGSGQRSRSGAASAAERATREAAQVISPYGFAYDTLAKTLIDLGADMVAAHHPQGYSLLSGVEPIRDPWVAEQIAAGLGLATNRRLAVGTIITDQRALNLLPPRSSRIIVAALPYGYLVAHLAGFENWASDQLARKLATAIEVWLAEHTTRTTAFPGPGGHASIEVLPRVIEGG
jgi:hypothetical protein